MPRVCAVALLLAATAFAQSYTPGPQVLTFVSSVDDSEQPYALYLPRAFEPQKAYPLVVGLHGQGSNHRLNLRRLFGKGNIPGETDLAASRYFPRVRDVDFIVASPLARGTMGYQGIAETDIYEMLADIRRRFRVDENRVFLTGLSMGGGGVLWLGLTRPDQWAAVAPVCPEVPDGAERLAPNALNLAVRLFQGDQDPIVPVDSVRQWHKRLLGLGVAAEYIEYPNVRHNAWDYAYRNGEIFDWFGPLRRNPFPDRVRFVSLAYRYRSAYWVELDALTPGTPASIDATFSAPNHLVVETRNVDGFTLRLTGHPRYTAGLPLLLAIDGSPVRPRPAAGLSFVRSPTGWKAGRAEPRGKRPGAEGPISEAVAARHIYVWGTADSPPTEERDRRRAVAERAAQWSEPQSRLMLALPVRPDTEIRDRDLETASLVLFGTYQTNRVIARMAGRLPISLNPGAADYGLLYLFPAGAHYVLINSGLPFWTDAEQAQRGGYRYSPRQLRLLESFGDFILFKGSVANVVAEGRFDNDWKLPPVALAALVASGTVSTR